MSLVFSWKTDKSARNVTRLYTEHEPNKKPIMQVVLPQGLGQKSIDALKRAMEDSYFAGIISVINK